MKTILEIRQGKIKQLANEFGTLKQLSELLEKSPAQVSQWKNGSKSSSTGKARGISDEVARYIEKKTDKPLGWLDNEIKQEDIDNTSQSPQARMIPLLTWVQAGGFCETGELMTIDEKTQHFPCPVASAGPLTFALLVKGDSMTASSPGVRSYPEGTIIYVDPEGDWASGSRVIARIGDKTTFKQLMEDEDGSYYLKPLNDRHPLIIPTGVMRICGVIIGAFMPE